MSGGGYDDGYRNCPCFWGTEPGSLRKSCCAIHVVSVSRASPMLDAGCGEGKNAAFLGYSVGPSSMRSTFLSRDPEWAVAVLYRSRSVSKWRSRRYSGKLTYRKC